MRALALIASVSFAACGGEGHGHSDQEVITTVRLELVPMGGGATVNAAFDDPDGDGGSPPIIDAIVLDAAKTYAVTVRFQNALETPPEEITDEIRDEAEDHQVFFTGDAVEGPASAQPGAPLLHAYTDADANGLPIGLSNTFATTGAGTGDLTVTLRHVPPINDTPVKTADLAGQVRAGGVASIGGESDVSVTFRVTVP